PAHSQLANAMPPPLSIASEQKMTLHLQLESAGQVVWRICRCHARRRHVVI
ncbi:hypothetical protein CLAFUW4_11138, partial [Fulvia fulva]